MNFKETDEPVLRLFTYQHGLILLRIFLKITDDLAVRCRVCEILALLPLPDKKMLEESGLIPIVDEYAKQKEVPKDIFTSLKTLSAASDATFRLKREPKIFAKSEFVSTPRHEKI